MPSIRFFNSFYQCLTCSLCRGRIAQQSAKDAFDALGDPATKVVVEVSIFSFAEQLNQVGKVRITWRLACLRQYQAGDSLKPVMVPRLDLGNSFKNPSQFS